MNFSSLRSGDESCPSDLALDRLHSGATLTTVKAHVDGCARCALRMKERSQGFDAVEGVDPRKMLAQVRTRLDEKPRSAFSFTRLWAPLGALAALALIFLVMPRGEDAEVTRLKGSVALHVFRQLEGGQGKEALSGDHFVAGDRLRFLVDLPRASRVRVYGQEATGALYTAWPLDPATPDSFAAGDRRELSGAVALDASAGSETLVLIACPAATEPACTSSGADSLECPKECSQVRFLMKKGAAP